MRLTKHHGLGNDFLVWLEPAGPDRSDVGPGLAAAACARHTGIGADGLIHGRVGPDDALVMTLWNADGGRAEMSGNGIGCLVQAAVLDGTVSGTDVAVATDAGPRTVRIGSGATPGTHTTEVGMGPARVTGAASEWVVDGVTNAAWVDTGNPHLVLHVPEAAAGPDLVEVGRRANRATGGVNVELIRALDNEGEELEMRVFERGAGVTLACGTGAVASAAVAHHWGLSGPKVTVVMPGGPAQVTLGDDVTLAGPVVAIAAIDWPGPV